MLIEYAAGPEGENNKCLKHFSSKQLKSIKPKIYSVFKGLESENILKIKDVILKIGKFKNVFYMKNGNYKMLKNKLSNIPIKNQEECNNTWGHPNLCNPSLTNHF